MYGKELIIRFLRARSEVKVFLVVGTIYVTNDGDLGDSNLGCICVELFGETVLLRSFLFIDTVRPVRIDINRHTPLQTR